MPRPRLQLQALAVAAASLIAGAATGACSHSTNDASGPATTSVGSTTTTTTAGPFVDSAGRAPRQVLRYGLHEGDQQIVVVTTDVSVAQELSSGDRLVDPPPVRQVIRFRVGAVDANG